MERFLRQLFSADTASAAAQAAVDYARTCMAADISWCGITKDGFLTMAAHNGLQTTEMMSLWRLEVGQGVGGRTAKEGRTHSVRDYRRDSRRVAAWKSIIDAEGIHGAICAPLTNGSEVLGVIYAASHVPRDWTPTELDRITSIGKDTGVALGWLRSRNRERQEAETARLDAAQVGLGLEAVTAMASALARTGDLGAGIGMLAHHLGRNLELLEPGGDLLRAVPAASEPDLPILCELPVGEEPIALLRVRGHRELSGHEQDFIALGARVLTLQLLRERAALRAELRLHGELVSELLNGQLGEVQETKERAALLGLDLRQTRYVACIGLHAPTESGTAVKALSHRLHDAIETQMCIHFPQSLVVRHADETVALLPGDADWRKVRGQLRRAVDDAGGTAGTLVAGIGRPCVQLGEYATSYAEASLALDVARRRPQSGEILGPDDLGLYGILARGSARGSLEAIVQNALGPLLEADADGGFEYLKTLEVYLACDRHLEKTAASLHIHTNTVRYRLAKMQEKLGVDLHDVEMRFLLELALRVHATLTRSEVESL